MAYKPKSQRSVIRDPQKARLFDNLTNNKNIEDIQALAGLNNGLADDVAILQTDVNTLESDVDSVQSDIVNLTNQVNSIVSLTDGDKGDITVSGSGASWTIDNSAVTDPKIFAVSAPKVIQDVNHLFVTNTEKATWNGKQDSLVSGINIKTINSNSLLGSGDLVIGGGGLTVGTTAIASGTVGRILFQNGGNVLGQDSALFWDNTNKRLGIGATPSTNVRLDVRAQGALSTDIGFRVRNSADTRDIINVRGNRTIELLADTPATNGGISITSSAYNEATINFYDSFTTNSMRIDSANALIAVRGSGNIRIGTITGDSYMGMVTPSSNNRFLKLVDAFGNEYLSIGGNSYDGSGGISMTLKTTTNNSTNFVTFSRSNNTNPVVINDQARVGIGTASPQARFDVRAQGALSTDIAFRVRNSADTADIFTANGDGTQNWFRPANNQLSTIKSGTYNFIQWSNEAFQNIAIGYSTSNLFTPTNYGNTLLGSETIIGSTTGGAVRIGTFGTTNGMFPINIGYGGRVNGTNTTKIGYHTGASSFGGSNSIHIGTTTSGNDVTPDNVFMTYFNSQSSSTLTRSNGSFGLLGQQSYIITNGTGIYGTDTHMGNGGNTLVIRNHTSIPSTNVTDSFQQYSADIVAGNAAPHFRTENGNIIKLFRGAALTASDGTLANAVTRIAELEARLQAHGLIA